MDKAHTSLFPPALAHGAIEEVFKDVFFVSGAMETVLMDLDWQFSRNMTIVRDGDRLILINSVRLSDPALNALDQLGTVTDVIRLGALHGRDDEFYVDRYNAQYWVMPGMDADPSLKAKGLSDDNLPISGASLFQFETSNLPEGVIRLDREGGILIACDALQNWLQPDEHFCDASRERMEGMGFFTPANVGPVWMQAAEPEAADFVRLKQIPFKHALCGHGEPLRDSAHEAYSATFNRLFNC
ncbi:hypothetical protein H9C73_14155 [Marinobacterium sp. AK62]|uniref:MBL fold metallo-hydrolase n=1 Tax=Marinobacterium alkalitolerans TaxID=1542925 RepID=A0ABS3ZDU8_9GAMM|nr:hypothetical protein [Marinobacterium alkalitolerans]MBP0049872.1 hypothetical protein [Marinobacterium alkalitolerans]